MSKKIKLLGILALTGLLYDPATGSELWAIGGGEGIRGGEASGTGWDR